METVAGAASVSQVVVYSVSSVRYVQQLYVRLKGCGSAYRDEETNLSLLLDVIKNISSQGVKDNDPILPILIEIGRLACEILHLLKPRVLLGFNWTPLTKQDELKSNLQILEKKRELLHLHLSQTNNKVLVAIQKTVTRQQTGLNSPPAMAPEPPRTIFSLKNNVVAGYQETLSGHQTLPDSIEIHNGRVEAEAIDLHANADTSTFKSYINSRSAAQKASNSSNIPAQPETSPNNVGGETPQSSETHLGTTPGSVKTRDTVGPGFVRDQRAKYFADMKTTTSTASPPSCQGENSCCSSISPCAS